MEKLLSAFITSTVLLFWLFSSYAASLENNQQQNLLQSSGSSNTSTLQVKNNNKRVSINHASAEELAAHLKGIGINKAKQIVDYREKYGAFTHIEQLKEVPGIGLVLYKQNEDAIEL